jgi:aspartate carbamoyltransferase regulatory subunit
MYADGRDHWVENLKCRQCEKTGKAELSMADGKSWIVRPDSVPSGFKVVESENGKNFYCAFCDRPVEA